MLPPRPRTLLDLLDERHALTPQQAAFYWDDQPFSFEMLWRGANRFAALLLVLGVARGDRVLIRLGNGPEFFDAFYGVLRAGAIAVPLFPASGPERIAALARLCGATLMVGPSANREDVAGVRTVSVSDSAHVQAPATFPLVAPDDVAFLQYTSGSTGSPKGVMLSHQGLLTNIGQLIGGMGLTASDVFVSWLPVFHDMGLIFMTMVPFSLGAKLVLLPTSLANARPGFRDRASPRYGDGRAGLCTAWRCGIRDPGAYDSSSAWRSMPLNRSACHSRGSSGRSVCTNVIAGWPGGGDRRRQHGCPYCAVRRRPRRGQRGACAGIDVQIIEGDEPLPRGASARSWCSPANTRGYFSDPGDRACSGAMDTSEPATLGIWMRPGISS